MLKSFWNFFFFWNFLEFFLEFFFFFWNFWKFFFFFGIFLELGNSKNVVFWLCLWTLACEPCVK